MSSFKHIAIAGNIGAGKGRDDQGKANALYVMFYYLGGWVGITVCGIAYKHAGWSAVVFICIFLLIIPAGTGVWERKISYSATRE